MAIRTCEAPFVPCAILGVHLFRSIDGITTSWATHAFSCFLASEGKLFSAKKFIEFKFTLSHVTKYNGINRCVYLIQELCLLFIANIKNARQFTASS